MIATLLAASGVAAADRAAGWTASLTPYLLLPGVDASLGVESPDGAPSAEAGPSDVLSLINVAVMLKAEARHERAFVYADWMYLDLGEVDSVVREIGFPDGTVPVGASLTLDSDASFDGFMVALGGGWRAIDGAAGDLDVYGGLRTLNLSTSLRWTLTAAVTSPGGGHTFPASGAIEGGSECWDAVGGVRGSWRLAEHWRVFGVADHGWGDGTQSWQAVAGLSWRLDTASVELAWREIAWQGLGDDKRGSLRLYGPVVGATFRF